MAAILQVTLELVMTSPKFKISLLQGYNFNFYSPKILGSLIINIQAKIRPKIGPFLDFWPEQNKKNIRN